MGGNLTASSIREDIGTVSYQTVKSTLYPPLPLHLTLSFTSLYFYHYELQFTQFDIQFGMSSKAAEYSSGCDWRSIPPRKRLEFASCRDTKPEILMVKDKMNRCTSCRCSLKLQQGENYLEPVLVLLQMSRGMCASCFYYVPKRMTRIIKNLPLFMLFKRHWITFIKQ